MIGYLISIGVTPQFLFGVAIGMALGLLTRLLEYRCRN